MKPAIELQEKGEAFYFIANYHSMTSLVDPAERRQNTLDVALDFLACGLDPKRTVFFRQSDVPEVTELTWMLGTVTPMGLLERCHSYKDKLAKGISPNYGLFAYPVLMAADILIYDSNVVPVGRTRSSTSRSRATSPSSSTSSTARRSSSPSRRSAPRPPRCPGSTARR